MAHYPGGLVIIFDGYVRLLRVAAVAAHLLDGSRIRTNLSLYDHRWHVGHRSPRRVGRHLLSRNDRTTSPLSRLSGHRVNLVSLRCSVLACSCRVVSFGAGVRASSCRAVAFGAGLRADQSGRYSGHVRLRLRDLPLPTSFLRVWLGLCRITRLSGSWTAVVCHPPHPGVWFVRSLCLCRRSGRCRCGRDVLFRSEEHTSELQSRG